MELTQEDTEFLKTYSAGDYERPSVTVDMLLFTVSNGKLQLMLIKRKAPPYKNGWAIPGGFLNMNESILQAAERELKEETNMSAYLHQFGVFGEVGRDPRTRVISIAYLALVKPEEFIYYMQAGDDAKEVKLFDVILNKGKIQKFKHPTIELTLNDLAFDHANIIQQGLMALQHQIKYSDIAFNLVDDKFTMYDFQQVYEAILDEKMTKPNFRRSFTNNYIKTGVVIELNEVSKKYQRPAKLYRRVK